VLGAPVRAAAALVATALAALPVVLVAREVGVVDNAIVSVPGGRVAHALGAQGHYLLGLVLARAPSVSYPIQAAGASLLELAVGGAAVLGSLALWWWPREARVWRRALLAWAWIWFVPISHLVAAVHILVADRFVYLWSLAGCAGAAWLALRLRGAWRLVVVGAALCALGIGSLRAEGAWTDSIALFARALAASPRDATACERLVSEQSRIGETGAALGVLERCLAANPEHPSLLLRQAGLLDLRGRHAEAIAVAARAAARGGSAALLQYTALLAQAGQREAALAILGRAAREGQAYSLQRVRWLLELDRPVEAEPLARAWLARRPFAGQRHAWLGLALARRGAVDEARAHLALAEALGARDSELAPLRFALARP